MGASAKVGTKRAEAATMWVEVGSEKNMHGQEYSILQAANVKMGHDCQDSAARNVVA